MEAKDFLEFGPFRVDTRSRVLLRGAEVVPLPPKAFDVLLTLLQKPGETLGRTNKQAACDRIKTPVVDRRRGGRSRRLDV